MEDSDGTTADGTRRMVVCAVDHSSHAHAVAYAAAGMAMKFDADVALFRSDRRVRGSRLEQLAAHGDLETLAHHSIGKPTGGRVKVSVDVTAEEPAEGIRRHIAASRPVAVLMGCRGRTLLARSLFGSTTHSLIRDATVPLMLLPPSDPEVFTVTPLGANCHIGGALIPVDFSESMDGQLRFASDFLATGACPVTLLHVARKGEADRSVTRLDELRLRLHAGRHPVNSIVMEGEVRRVLANLLSGDNYGIVVLGRDRHRSGAVASDLLRVSTALVAVAP